MRSLCTRAVLPQNYGGILIAKMQSQARLRRHTGTPGRTLGKVQRQPFGAQRPRHGTARAASTAKTAARAGGGARGEEREKNITRVVRLFLFPTKMRESAGL